MNTSIGQQLRQAREARQLSLEQVATATRIRAYYLRAMEDGDFEKLPSTVQARGFLRTYADYLHLDTDELLLALQGKTTPPQASPVSLPEQPPVTSPEDEGAEKIFKDIGQRLIRQRELLGFSYEDVEHHTRLRRQYLQVLEEGKLDELPSPVQARGMLSNYATFLGLNPDSLLLRFAEGLQAQLVERQATRSKQRPSTRRREPISPTPIRRLFSGDVLVGVGLVIFLVAFVAWGTIRIFAMRSSQTPTATAPSIVEVLLATPTPTETLTPAPATATNPAPAFSFPTQPFPTDATSIFILQVTPRGRVQIYVAVRQRTWMRASVDNKVEFEGRVLPDSAYTFVGENQVEIQTGNGAALQIFFNQQDMGPMGGFGEVVDRIYTLQGILAPTPTVTFTPTITLSPTATPRTMATPNPSTATRPALP